MSIRVSILIPVWNGAKYLREALDSALAQTLPAHEIVISNNGSTDETPAILAEYGARHGVKVHTNAENIGSARNFAAVASKATGDYLLWLPADDRLHPELLATAAPQLTAHPEVGMWFCGFEVIDGDGRPSQSVPQTAFGTGGVVAGREVLEHLLTRGQPMLVNGTIVPRRVFEAVGGFDTRFLGACDFDLYVRIAGQYTAFVERRPLGVGRRHQNQHSSRILVRDNGDPDRLFARVADWTFLNEDQRRRYVEGLSEYARQYFSRPLRTPRVPIEDVIAARTAVCERLAKWQASGLAYAKYVRAWPEKPLAIAAWFAGSTRPGVWLARTALSFGKAPDLRQSDEVAVDPGSELVAG